MIKHPFKTLIESNLDNPEWRHPAFPDKYCHSLLSEIMNYLHPGNTYLILNKEDVEEIIARIDEIDLNDFYRFSSLTAHELIDLMATAED